VQAVWQYRFSRGIAHLGRHLEPRRIAQCDRHLEEAIDRRCGLRELCNVRSADQHAAIAGTAAGVKTGELSSARDLNCGITSRAKSRRLARTRSCGTISIA